MTNILFLQHSSLCGLLRKRTHDWVYMFHREKGKLNIVMLGLQNLIIWNTKLLTNSPARIHKGRCTRLLCSVDNLFSLKYIDLAKLKSGTPIFIYLLLFILFIIIIYYYYYYYYYFKWYLTALLYFSWLLSLTTQFQIVFLSWKLECPDFFRFWNLKIGTIPIKSGRMAGMKLFYKILNKPQF